MPIPVPSWVADTWPGAKSLNLALYTSDGTLDNPTGVAFLAYRPLFFESYTATTTFHSASGGSQTSMSSAASSAASCNVVLDSAGYYGQTSDLPGQGYYQYTPVIAGTAGDGVTAGGYMVVSSFVPLKPTSTQTSVSADLYEVGVGATSGSRQQPNTTNDSCPFYLDLVNTGGQTWAPAVTLYDSGAATAQNAVSADASGETPRFGALWAAVSATTTGQITYSANGVYSWTAPAGVTSVTVSATAAGAGGGAGNVSGGGTEFGGGGGGGGEFASGSVAVTPGDVYAPTVGAGGAAGAEPGGTGAAGGTTVFAGDVANVTAHGGSSGAGASVSGNGAGGLGGTGAGGTHFNGGAGKTGSTGSYGGGGGSSAGPAVAGNSATSSAGAAAPAGGGPGGTGGKASISIVQSGGGTVTGNVNLTLTFSALQAGNTIVVCTGNQARPSSGDPTVTLNDGTVLESATTADGPNITNGIFSASNVTGGQTSATVTYIHSATTVVTMGQFFEVAGLGSSPGSDGTGNAVQNSASSWSTSTVTGGAPDLWIGSIAADSGAGSFSLNPGGSWTKLSQTGATVGAVSGAMRSGYQIVTASGTATWSGSISGNVANYGANVAAFTSTATTAGAAPLSLPGGGGGGGLGTANGGNGVDGKLTLTWTGTSGGGYGTPQVPTPYSNWGASTRVGTSGDANADVDLNSSSGITGVVNFLDNAPIFRIAGTNAQSVSTATLTAVAFTGATATVDSYSGYSAGTYTIQRAGLYLFHGLVAFANASGGTRQAGVTINGTTYWGPGNLPTAAGTCNVTKTQVFSLQAGDTVQLACRQDKGSSVSLATTDSTRMMLMWLNEVGTPSTLWTPPDPTYRWVSGTPVGALPALFQQHLANDLGFLCQGPYLMAYQTAAQSGLTASAFATVTMDTVGGIVHSDTGDNYSGWTSGASNLYTAQQPGWYLCVAEYFLSSSAASGATAVAAVLPATSGGMSPLHTPDTYQRLSATATASVGGGCTAVGYYYLLAGETLTPQAEGLSYSGTFSTLAGTQNSGQFNSHIELIWVSN